MAIPRQWISRIVRLGLLVALIGLPTPQPAHAEPTGPTETPERIVAETWVNVPKEWTTGGGLLYWANRCYGGEFRGDGYLRRMPIYLGTIRTLATVDRDNCFTFLAMAADDSGLYYYSRDAKRIEFRPANDPENPVTVISTTRVPLGKLALDGNYIYWMDSYTVEGLPRGNVLRVRKDGGGGVQILDAGRVNPGTGRNILVVNGMVYFLDAGGLNRMDCSSTPCTAPRVLVPGTTGRDLHYADETVFLPFFQRRYSLYWVEDTSPERIRRYHCRFVPLPLPGRWICSDSVLYTAPNNDWSIFTPLPQGGNLYFAEKYAKLNEDPDGRIRRLPLGGGTAESIVVNRPYLDIDPGVQVDSRYVYFMDQDVNRAGVYRLPLDAAAITWDLKADGLEITQAIQDLDQNPNNDVPLVANKATYVRAYARLLSGPEARNVQARLHGSRAGSPLPGSPLSPMNGVLALATAYTYDRANLDDGWLFRLPASWTQEGTITLRLEVDPQGIYDDSRPNNNRLSRTVTFHGKAPVCIVFVPVRTHGPYASLDNPNFWPMVDMAQRLWPTPAYWIYYQTEDIAELGFFSFNPYELPEDNWKVLTSLNIRDFFTDDPDRCDDAGAKTHYVGMVHHSISTQGVLGVAYRNDNVAWVKFPPESPTASNDFDWPDAGITLAHELGHNQGRKHVDCGGPANPDPNYPYPTNQIGNVSPTGYYGFDPKTRTPIPPNRAKDYMSYCSPEWTSDYTWRAIYNSLGSTGAVQATQVDETAAGGLVLVTGGINPTAGEGTLNYAWVYPATAMSAGMWAKWTAAMARNQPPQTSNAVTYRLRLRDPSGAVLAEQPVTLLESEDLDTETRAFLLTFPAPSGTVATVELVADGTVLDRRAPGTGTPTVTILQPASGETVQDELTLSWQAQDPDPEDELLFTVQYSPDNGATWFSLLTDYPAPPGADTVTLTLQNLTTPGSRPGQARIRVAASDGYHTGLATSPGFTVTNRKPRAFIASPTAEESIPADEPVLLRGAGMDVEDGGLSDSALRWRLNGQDKGTGREVVVAGLAPGDYQAQLTVTDSDGQSDTATVNFQVTTLGIPQGVPPILDGFCDDAAYGDGVSLLLAPYSDGRQAQVSLVRDGNYLWACFANMAKGTGGPTAFAGLRVDVDNSRDALAQSDDYGFFVAEDGTPFTYAADGAGGFDDPGPGGLTARVSASDDTWNGELRIAKDVLGGWDHLVGLNLGHYWVRFQGDDYEWPFDTVYNRPNTWALTALGDLPRLDTLTPSSVTAGGADLDLVVQGRNFLDGAVVRWNGTDLATQFGSSTVLTATVPAARIASPGTATVTVRNPGGADLVSNPLPFLVQSPTPTITALSPDSAAQGHAGFTLTVDGSNFLDGAVVLWDGVALPTTYMSATRLQATVAPTHLARRGQVGVAVRNPGPNAPVSEAATFTVEPRLLYLPLVTK